MEFERPCNKLVYIHEISHSRQVMSSILDIYVCLVYYLLLMSSIYYRLLSIIIYYHYKETTISTIYIRSVQELHKQ